MKIIVNEPQVDYKVKSWKPDPNTILFDNSILKTEIDTIFYRPYGGSIGLIIGEKPIKRISSLRGKMTRQDEKEIDNQLSELRNEWERDI